MLNIEWIFSFLQGFPCFVTKCNTRVLWKSYFLHAYECCWYNAVWHSESLKMMPLFSSTFCILPAWKIRFLLNFWTLEREVGEALKDTFVFFFLTRMESAACSCNHTEIKIGSFPYVSVLTLIVTFPVLKLLFLVLVGNHSNKIYLVTVFITCT